MDEKLERSFGLEAPPLGFLRQSPFSLFNLRLLKFPADEMSRRLSEEEVAI